MTTFASPVAPRTMKRRSTTVAEIMTRNPLTFEKQMPLQKAFALLQYNQLDAAPVVDERGRLVGIVTMASCAAWEEFSLRSSPHGFVPKELDTTPVWEISNPVVERIREDTSAEQAIDFLSERRVRRIYVVNKHGELVGVVSIADLFRHLNERASRSQASRAGAAPLC